MVWNGPTMNGSGSALRSGLLDGRASSALLSCCARGSPIAVPIRATLRHQHRERLGGGGWLHLPPQGPSYFNSSMKRRVSLGKRKETEESRPWVPVAATAASVLRRRPRVRVVVDGRPSATDSSCRDGRCKLLQLCSCPRRCATAWLQPGYRRRTSDTRQRSGLVPGCGHDAEAAGARGDGRGTA